MAEKDYFGWEEMKKETLCCTGHDSLEKAIDGCNNLEELFRLWKIAQMCETDPKSSSFPNLSLAKCSGLTFSDTFASSFCPDGFLSKQAKPEAPVLFICRESNISDNIDNRTLKLKSADKQIFWLREVVRCRGGKPASYYISPAERDREIMATRCPALATSAAIWQLREVFSIAGRAVSKVRAPHRSSGASL